MASSVQPAIRRITQRAAPNRKRNRLPDRVFPMRIQTKTEDCHFPDCPDSNSREIKMMSHTLSPTGSSSGRVVPISHAPNPSRQLVRPVGRDSGGPLSHCGVSHRLLRSLLSPGRLGPAPPAIPPCEPSVARSQPSVAPARSYKSPEHRCAGPYLACRSASAPLRPRRHLGSRSAPGSCGQCSTSKLCRISKTGLSTRCTQASAFTLSFVLHAPAGTIAIPSHLESCFGRLPSLLRYSTPAACAYRKPLERSPPTSVHRPLVPGLPQSRRARPAGIRPLLRLPPRLRSYFWAGLPTACRNFGTM